MPIMTVDRVPRTSWLLLLLLLASAANWPTPMTAAFGSDTWPRFRGPGGSGVAADDPRLTETWNTTEHIAWAADVPGWGWASPVVVAGKVYLSTVVADDDTWAPAKGLYLGEGVRDPAAGTHHWLVLCYDLASGRELWRHEAHRGEPTVPRHPKSTYAAETPTTDGERLYVLFGDVGLFAYSLTGEPLWTYEIEPKKTFFDYGAAASPVVHDGQVFVVYDNLEDSWIASIDAATGQERWRTPRSEQRSWATPLVWTHSLRTEIVVPGLNRNRSYDLQGRLLWEFDGRMSNLVIPSPFAAHGMVYIASGYVGDRQRPTFAIKPGGSGDLAPDGLEGDHPFIAWHQPQASPYNPSQIVVGPFLYTLYDRGFLTCHDAVTGEEIYGKQRLPEGASFTASPWSYNGKLFCLSEDGDTFVVASGPEFELLATNPLEELCMACPAVADGRLLIRTASRLVCITAEANSTPAEARPTAD